MCVSYDELLENNQEINIKNETILEQGKRLFKRHWRKTGYGFIIYGIGILLSALVFRLLSNEMIQISELDSAEEMLPFQKIRQLFGVIPILAMLLGIILIVIGGIWIKQDRCLKKRQHK